MSTATATDSIVRDERGAVMMTGVFMGSFLIGATWATFGIARAAVFRDRVQEAADAAAFSSAALHAKGMNLIAAINLVFFAVTSIWLMLRVFEDILGTIQSTVLGNSGNCHGFLCHVRNPCELREAALAATGVGATIASSVCKISSVTQDVRDVTNDARKTIGDAMFRVFPPLSKVQDVTARLAPIAGAAASVTLGAKFNHFTVALSASMIPVDDIVSIANKARGATGDEVLDKPLGLPVTAKKFGTLCGRAAKIVFEKILDAFRAIPVLGKIVDVPIISNVINGVINGTAGAIEKDYCGDGDYSGHSSITKIFKMKGPKAMFGHAENGNDLMQIYSFTRGTYDDSDGPRVAVAGRKFGQGGGSTSNFYLAQSEFYFDCDGAWGDNQCNGSNDNTMYNMKWRARLRRLHAPDVGAELGRFLRDAAFSGPVADAIKDAVGLGAPAGGTTRRSGGKFDDQTIKDGLFDEAFGFINGKVTEAAGVGNDKTGKTPSGSFH